MAFDELLSFVSPAVPKLSGPSPQTKSATAGSATSTSKPQTFETWATLSKPASSATSIPPAPSVTPLSSYPSKTSSAQTGVPLVPLIPAHKARTKLPSSGVEAGKGLSKDELSKLADELLSGGLGSDGEGHAKTTSAQEQFPATAQTSAVLSVPSSGHVRPQAAPQAIGLSRRLQKLPAGSLDELDPFAPGAVLRSSTPVTVALAIPIVRTPTPPIVKPTIQEAVVYPLVPEDPTEEIVSSVDQNHRGLLDYSGQIRGAVLTNVGGANINGFKANSTGLTLAERIRAVAAVHEYRNDLEDDDVQTDEDDEFEDGDCGVQNAHSFVPAREGTKPVELSAPV